MLELIHKQFFPAMTEGHFEGCPSLFFLRECKLKIRIIAQQKCFPSHSFIYFFFIISFHSQVKECRLFEELICSGGAST